MSENGQTERLENLIESTSRLEVRQYKKQNVIGAGQCFLKARRAVLEGASDEVDRLLRDPQLESGWRKIIESMVRVTREDMDRTSGVKQLARGQLQSDPTRATGEESASLGKLLYQAVVGQRPSADVQLVEKASVIHLEANDENDCRRFVGRSSKKPGSQEEPQAQGSYFYRRKFSLADQSLAAPCFIALRNTGADRHETGHHVVRETAIACGRAEENGEYLDDTGVQDLLNFNFYLYQIGHNQVAADNERLALLRKLFLQGSLDKTQEELLAENIASRELFPHQDALAQKEESDYYPYRNFTDDRLRSLPESFIESIKQDEAKFLTTVREGVAVAENAILALSFFGLTKQVSPGLTLVLMVQPIDQWSERIHDFMGEELDVYEEYFVDFDPAKTIAEERRMVYLGATEAEIEGHRRKRKIKDDPKISKSWAGVVDAVRKQIRQGKSPTQLATSRGVSREMNKIKQSLE